MADEKAILKNIIAENFDKPVFYKRNLLKEYLQVLILDFIYSSPKYGGLIFYGGTCLAHCFGLRRLSEDIDFVDDKKEIDIETNYDADFDLWRITAKFKRKKK